MATAEPGNQQRDKSITEHALEHALVIDHGWREVADKALAFVKRFV
jgi:hypothetical protein